MMLKLTENLLFVTSCVSTYVDGIDHASIVEAIEKIQSRCKGNRRSNEGGYQSLVQYSPEYDNAETTKLFENYIVPAAKNIQKMWSLPTIMEKVGYWYNVNPKYSSNREHSHPRSFLSGVYYVKVPADSGKIIFLRSSTEHDRLDFVHQEITTHNLTIDNNRINSEHWFAPKEGMLLFFPGHLSHYVRQNCTNDIDDRRISLSFNFI